MSILGKAKVCKDKVQKKDSPTKQCTTLQEKDCCINKAIVKVGDDTFKRSNTILESETLVFVNTFLYTYINLFEGLGENVISFQTYRPPFLSTDIQVLQQTFLI
ncbi:hypothetical protein BXY75_3278 [Ulvibacter antarcticus]|uniref:Uncharacterized protein n=1 Tax=Ulvibacter antarcticus TaxID=442714 RepID=A0A3L9YBM7_9FLAO|nr:hypothetical protein [Ulvibacter antarcticus]RMA56760.1 hypothetical protein BXY75_3278 [Ulvibacter antarcticus]